MTPLRKPFPGIRYDGRTVRRILPSLLVLFGINLLGYSENRKLQLTVAGEYRNNRFEDISRDGSLLLFYQTAKPTRAFGRISAEGKVTSSRLSREPGDLLRVVERATAREMAKIEVEFIPSEVQFVPESSEIFYREPKANTGKQIGSEIKLWNYETGSTRVICRDDEVSFVYVRVLNARQAVGRQWIKEKQSGVLATLDLGNGERTIKGPFDPSHPLIGGISDAPTLSPDQRLVAYYYTGLYPVMPALMIRRADTLELVKREDLPSEIHFDWKRVVYSPGHGLCSLIGVDRNLGKRDDSRTLLFYDPQKAGVVRRVDIDLQAPHGLSSVRKPKLSWQASALAISPDSQLLAVSCTTDDRWPKVGLFDLGTGKLITVASHPQVKPQRSDPFATIVGKLAFTPDGKYLISTGHDTYVWRIEEVRRK